MSDSDLSTPLRVESAPAPTELITSLGSLRALRTSKGLTVQEVSVRLKYSARHIESLEDQSMDRLPHGLALKSLIKSYCKLLGVDSKPLEAELDAYIGRVEGGIANHTSTRSLGAHQGAPTGHTGGWAWVVLILLVMCAVFGIAIWQGLIPSAWIPNWLEVLFA
jgi:cytoskeleton protein RodZ